MDFNAKKNKLQHLMDEEKNNKPSDTPIHQEFDREHEFRFSPSRPPPYNNHNTAASNTPSPWTLSPLQTPSPSLLYHCIISLHRQDGNIHSIALSKGVIFTGSDSNQIRLWKQPDCLERGFMKASYGEVRSILVYDNMVFTSHKDFKVRIWKFEGLDKFRWKQIATLPEKSSFHSVLTRKIISERHPNYQYHQQQKQHKDWVSCMAYNHGEGLLYTCSWDKTVKVWRISNSQCVDSFLAHKDHVNAIIVNQEDGCLYTCSSDGSLKIWRRVYNENSHALVMTLKIHKSPINALATVLSNDTTFLYSGSSDGFICFWEKDRMCGRFSHGGCLQGHRLAVLCLFASDKLIFSGSEDTTIRIWRRDEGSCVHESLALLEGHKGPVKCLAACMETEKLVNGFLVYSAGIDQSFKVWRVKIMAEESKGECDSDGQSDSNGNKETTESEIMSPVLSPPWVERKLQGANHSFPRIDQN